MRLTADVERGTREERIIVWLAVCQDAYFEKLRRSLALQQSRKSVARPKCSTTQASSSEQQHCSSVSLIQQTAPHRWRHYAKISVNGDK